MNDTQWRSKSAVAAVILNWVTIFLISVAYIVLDTYIKLGNMSWLAVVGFIILALGLVADLAAIVTSIIAIVKDRGRVRIGAILLVLIPVVFALYLLWAFHSTVLGTSPWRPLTYIVMAVLLIVGTLLIVLPEKYGTD